MDISVNIIDYGFNKKLLLSSKFIDEFNLHLPNPKVMIEKIIEKDDYKVFYVLLNELKGHFTHETIIYRNKVNICYDKFKLFMDKILSNKNSNNKILLYMRTYGNRLFARRYLDEHKENISSDILDYLDNMIELFYSRDQGSFYEIFLNDETDNYIINELEGLLIWDDKIKNTIFYEIYMDWIIEFVELTQILQPNKIIQ